MQIIENVPLAPMTTLKVGGAARYFATAVTAAEVRQAVPGVELVAGTGVTIVNVGRLLSVADGVIVVSSLRQDGRTLNPVDPARVEAFMKAARRVAASA